MHWTAPFKKDAANRNGQYSSRIQGQMDGDMAFVIRPSNAFDAALGSEAARLALAIYGSEMQPAAAEEFFARAKELFHIGRSEILLDTEGQAPHCELRGDLRC